MATIEKRIISGCSLRAMSEGDELSLVGYAARYGVQSHCLNSNTAGPFREIIQRGAFRRALSEGQDVVATFNHDASAIPLGRTKSGTLKLGEDENGLKFRCQLDPNQSAHRDLHNSVKRGDVADCSFAFTVNGDNGDDWNLTGAKDDSGNRCALRTLKDVNLHDVSVVSHPAYPNTSVDARAHYAYSISRTQSSAAADAEMRKQIAAFDARQKSLRVERFKRARAICAQYPELSYEHVLHCIRLNYSEDVMLQLRFAAITEKIHRAGVAFEAEPMRGDGGQAADPTQSLRDAACDASEPDEHSRAAEYHRACARKASTMQRGVEHFKAADAHDLAAQTGDAQDSSRARASSRLLAGE